MHTTVQKFGFALTPYYNHFLNNNDLRRDLLNYKIITVLNE